MRWWKQWSTWLCLSLMFWTAAAESTHNHPNQAESATCSICLVAHTARPAITAANRTPMFIAVGLLQEDDIISRPRLDFSDLGIRGPPIAL